MFNLIYLLKDKEIGTGQVSINMEKTYPDLFKSYNIKDNDIPLENRIWQIQNPYLYKYNILNRANDYIFLRKPFSDFFIGKKITNGFSYLKMYRSSFKYFLPTIYQSNFKKSYTPAIGYYVRDCRIQSNIAFLNFISQIPKNIPIITMGTKELIQDKIPLDVEWYHTYDNNIFWKLCSHFFYYRCSDFQDPVPHTLLEAIQSQHRIISPVDYKRKFKDGIDDLLSCIEYDEQFKPYNIGEKCEYLESSNWINFYKKISSNRFEINYSLNKDSFKEWIDDNVLGC